MDPFSRLIRYLASKNDILLLVAAITAVGHGRSIGAQQTTGASPGVYPHAAEPIGTVRQMYNGALTPDLAVNTFRNIDRLFPTRLVPRSANPLPLPPARTELTEVPIFDRGRTFSLDGYIDLNRVAGLIVLKDGRVAFETYRFGNSENTRWMSMSIAKSITSTLFGAAVKQGLIRLTDSVTHYVPSLARAAPTTASRCATSS